MTLVQVVVAWHEVVDESITVLTKRHKGLARCRNINMFCHGEVIPTLSTAAEAGVDER